MTNAPSDLDGALVFFCLFRVKKHEDTHFNIIFTKMIPIWFKRLLPE